MTEVISGIEAGVRELTDAGLERTLPCQSRHLRLREFRKMRAFREGSYDGTQCGRPSVVRLRVHCYSCGAKYRLFLCRRCTFQFKRGLLIACRICGQEGKCRGTES
jgi:hypothetical protein